MRMSKIVAIHQPNFFPWLGYFEKIARSEVFVVLDHVQYPKNGRGSWSNRVKLMSGGAPRWLTAPIDREFHGVRAINEITFKEGASWRDNFLKNLKMNYAKAPFAKDTLDFIAPLIVNPESNMAKYNFTAIKSIAGYVGLSSEKFLFSSNFELKGQGTEMLIELTRVAGGGTYMCGGGAEGYQDNEAFAAAGINLLHQNYQHPIYPQIARDDFVPGLSIIDALMNLGRDRVNGLLTAASIS